MSVARQTGPEGRYEVVHERVAVRSSPSMMAPLRGALTRGCAVRGKPHVVESSPWLRLARASCEELGLRGAGGGGGWMLIHGRGVGLGVLLQPLAPDAPSAEKGLSAGVSAAEAQPRPVGEHGEFIVVHERVAARQQPSMEADEKAVLAKGTRIRGVPFEVNGIHWLKLDTAERWILMDEGPLGLGALLVPVEAEGLLESGGSSPSNAGQGSMVSISVKGATSGDAIAAVQVREAATVWELKQAITKACGEHLYSQRLLLGSRVLGNDERLAQLPDLREVQLLRLPFNAEAGNDLMQGASAGDVPAVVGALEALACPDHARAEDGQTPLLAAAGREASLELVRRLCEAGADVRRANAAGAAPLHAAAQRGGLEVAEHLCRAGARLDARTQGGATPLHLAARQGHWQVVRRLCQLRASVDAVNQSGASPLYMASQAGSLDAMRTLCEWGACPNLAKQGGATPLHIAAQRGHTVAVQHLCEAGAEKDAVLGEASETFAREDKPMLDGATPLILAAYHGHMEVAQCLFLAGADKEIESHGGFTAFQVAGVKRHREVSQVLSITSVW